MAYFFHFHITHQSAVRVFPFPWLDGLPLMHLASRRDEARCCQLSLVKMPHYADCTII
jgi:hypothetical protein